MVYEIQTIIRLMIETWMIVLWMIVSYPDEVEPRRSLARGFLSQWEVQPEGELRQTEVNGTLNLPRGFPFPSAFPTNCLSAHCNLK